jgi:hypothetical protein
MLERYKPKGQGMYSFDPKLKTVKSKIQEQREYELKKQEFKAALSKYQANRTERIRKLKEQEAESVPFNNRMLAGNKETTGYLVARLHENVPEGFDIDVLDQKHPITSVQVTSKGLIVKLKGNKTVELGEDEKNNYLRYIINGNYNSEDKKFAYSQLNSDNNDLMTMMRQTKKAPTSYIKDVIPYKRKWKGHDIEMTKTKEGTLRVKVDNKEITIEDAVNPELAFIEKINEIVNK